jgi:hypothetical protein
VPVDSAAVAHVAAAMPACTKHWLYASNGNWNAAGNWTPSGVPRAGDVACIDAIGAYTVTVNVAPANLGALIIGGRSVQAKVVNPIGAPTSAWTFPGGMQIVAGSSLIVRAFLVAMLSPGPLLIDGSVVADSSTFALGFVADSVVIRGSLDCATYSCSLLANHAIRTSGTLTTKDFSVMTLSPGADALWIEGGSLSGAGSFQSSRTTHWSAGSIPARLTDGSARFTQEGATLYLDADTLSGAVSMLTQSSPFGASVIRGDIGAGVHLFAGTRDSLGTLSLGGARGGPLTNHGVLTFQPGPRHLTVTGAGVVNLATMELDFPAGLTEFATDSVVNQGTVTVTGHSLLSGNLNFLRNRGTITVPGSGLLELNAADLIAEQGSTITGAMKTTGSLITGTGRIGDVTAIGTQFEPGAPIGQLTVGRLTLDNTSSVGIDVAGISNFDRLRVLTGITYAGTLSIREIAPFVSATCGQMLPIISDHSTGSRGAFTKFAGLTPAFTRGWRIHNPTDTLYLVGHNPIVPVTASATAVTVGEGGASASYSVCLRSAPGANVTIAPASTAGQVAAITPLLFTPTTWAPPQVVTIAALDDAIYEPVPTVDDVQYTITSTDPQYIHAGLASLAATVTDNDGSTNLELTLLSPPPVAVSGTNFTLSISDDNLGPDASPGATFNVPASVGYSYVSSTGAISCASDAITGTTCQLAGVAAGQHIPVSITFTAGTPGSYSTTYHLTSVQPDPVPGNNNRTQLITIQ